MISKELEMDKALDRARALRWQDWVNLVLGIWLFVSPWALGFQAAMPGSSGNFFIVGVAIIVLAIVGLNARWLWQEWLNLALGIWLVVSPWLLGFSADAAARDDAIFVGIVAGVMAAWALLERHRVGAATSAGGEQRVTH
jgi:hypothetical protein